MQGEAILGLDYVGAFQPATFLQADGLFFFGGQTCRRGVNRSKPLVKTPVLDGKNALTPESSPAEAQGTRRASTVAWATLLELQQGITDTIFEDQ